MARMIALDIAAVYNVYCVRKNVVQSPPAFVLESPVSKSISLDVGMGLYIQSA